MSSLPLDLSASEKPRQIQGNMVAYMKLFADLPGMVMFDRDVFCFISHLPAPGNGIYRSRLIGEDVEEQIDALFEQISQHLDQIDWMLFPCDLPSDLGRRLEARGMPGGPAGNWLWADLSSLDASPTVPQNFHIKQVQDDHMMAEWTRLSEAGFEVDDLSCFYDAYAQHGYGKDAFSLHYIGYLDDIAVTSATLLDAGGWASLYDISTPQEFRRQGFGGAITQALMQEIKNRGYQDTWIWSSNMAKSLYQSLGYVDVEFGIRDHTWHKT